MAYVNNSQINCAVNLLSDSKLAKLFLPASESQIEETQEIYSTLQETKNDDEKADEIDNESKIEQVKLTSEVEIKKLADTTITIDQFNFYINKIQNEMPLERLKVMDALILESAKLNKEKNRIIQTLEDEITKNKCEIKCLRETVDYQNFTTQQLITQRDAEIMHLNEELKQLKINAAYQVFNQIKIKEKKSFWKKLIKKAKLKRITGGLRSRAI